VSDDVLMNDDFGKPGQTVQPEESGRRGYVLLPQIRDISERVEWRIAVAIGSSQTSETIGHSRDEAGAGAPDRQVTAVNPEHWGENLKSWYEERYPGISYRAVVAELPWEVALHLLPELQEDVALAQTDPRWKDCDFGEERDAETIGGYGGLLTGLTIMLRKIYQRNVTPPDLDKLLVAVRAAFVDGNVLLWHSAVSSFSAFDDSISDDKRRSAEQLETLLNEGWEILLRGLGESGQEGKLIAYLESVEGGVLHVIDTRDGQRRERTSDVYQGIRAAHVKEMPATPSFEVLSGGTEQTAGTSLESYDHSLVILPGIEEEIDRSEWRMAAAIGSSVGMETVGHEPEDAVVPHRRVLAVNPAQWRDDLKAWYEEHRSEARVQEVEAASPWEMAVKLLPKLKDDIALAQTDPRWASYDFGEHPDVGGETLGHYGCFLTGLAVILRQVYGRDVTPPVLDKLLVAARSAYVYDNFMAWRGAVPLFPAFDESIKDNVRRSARELRQMLDEGWEVVLRRADGGHFVYLEDVEGETLHIIDTWDGKRKQKTAAHYLGVRAAHVREDIGREVAPVLVGLYDGTGGEWMVDEGLVGCCVVPRQVQRQPIELDFTDLSEAGLVLIARLGWGYADGTGTLPTPTDREAFTEAVVETIRSARGVDYFYVGSEPNNRREWPGFGKGNAFALTPEYVSEVYNDIWQGVDGRARMGPPPMDPYFGPGSNSREWWTYVLEHIDGADALFLHAKTQTNDPDEVWSKEKFSDWPLEWQYRHLSTVETSLEVVPDRFEGLPIFVSELNPQCLRTPGGDVGWLHDNAEWVRQALRYFREETPVTAVSFYRYGPAGDQTPFSLRDMPVILKAIKEEAETSLESGEGVARPPGLPADIWRRIVEARS
jgi:hypothetical protein